MRLIPIMAVVVVATLIPSPAMALSEITTTTSSGRTVTVTAFSDNILRVTNTPSATATPTSRSVIMQPENIDARISDSSRVAVLTTPSGVVATIDKASGAVSFSCNGKLLADAGSRTTADDKTILRLSTTGNCSFYGAGERGHSLDLRGDTLVMYNRQNYGYTGSDPRISQMNITVPLFISSDGYAVLFDDYAPATMIMGNPVEYITENTQPIAYYFINGESSLADVSREYTRLTGHQKLAPFWSLGYITSKYGYHNEKETRGVIDTLKRRGYPVDGVVLDLYWYGKEEDMGRLDWDPGQWPSHKKMLADLKKQGVKTVLISQPYVLRNGKGLGNYNFLSENGMLGLDSAGKTQEVKIWVGEGGMLDVSNPATRQWLRERYRKLTEEGVGGWWGDLGEPEVHPEQMLHNNGLTARQYHNQYGNDWSEIISELFEEEFPDRRLMTMMRGGTAGLQRYSVFPWSTDVSRSWGGLEPQIKIMLNSGLSGLGYMSHDVGGFAIDPENPVDPELYVRWLQLGAFSPILRTHSQQVAEPYHYPDQQNIIKALISDRYRWLPYNYTLAYENATQGYPLVRPLNFHDAVNSEDKSIATDTVTDQYLWGRDVMIAPVLEQGARSRTILFPSGEWIDRLNPRNKFAGHSETEYSAPLDVLPIFIRSGAFIPMADYKMGNTSDYDPSRYTIYYYPRGGESEFTMFEDDRLSPSSLDKKEYSLITFHGDDSGKEIKINVSMSGTYPGAPATRHLVFMLPGIDKPEAVTINGRPLKLSEKESGWYYNNDKDTLEIRTKWIPLQPLTITIAR